MTIMRNPTLLAIAIIAALATVLLPTPAFAYHESGEPDNSKCPAYTDEADLTPGYAIAWNARGQFLLTVTAPEEVMNGAPRTFYYTSDAPYADPLNNTWLWSIWWYEETNGMPGLQRQDFECDTTHGGTLFDGDSCLCV